MSTSTPQPDPRIEAYLDGTLSAAARADFEREMASNEALRRAVQAAKQVDESLQRQFQPTPLSGDFLDRLRAAHATTEPATVPMVAPQHRSRLTGWMAAVASILVWGGLGWYFLAPMFERPAPLLPVNVAQQYKQCVEGGFHPSWVCKDDHEFASTFLDRQGQGMLLAQMPEGSKMVGLTYYAGLTPRTTTMFARVNDTPVIVYVDRDADHPDPAMPAPDSGLHMYRKQMGPVVLFEVSPLDEPRVMDYLYPADVPPAASPQSAPSST